MPWPFFERSPTVSVPLISGGWAGYVDGKNRRRVMSWFGMWRV